MPVYAKLADDSQAQGYITYPQPYFRQGLPSSLEVRADIANDLSALSPIIYEFTNWGIAWSPVLYAGNFLSNISKFKSAVPKYDYGYYDVAYRGWISDSGFWNYQVQKLPSYFCWAYTGEEEYPSFPEPNPYIGNAEVINFNYYPVLSVQTPGTELIVLPSNADVNATIVHVVYFAYHITGSLPVSFGDI